MGIELDKIQLIKITVTWQENTNFTIIADSASLLSPLSIG